MKNPEVCQKIQITMDSGDKFLGVGFRKLQNTNAQRKKCSRIERSQRDLQKTKDLVEDTLKKMHSECRYPEQVVAFLRSTFFLFSPISFFRQEKSKFQQRSAGIQISL